MRATQGTRLCLLDGFRQDYTGMLSCFLAGISTCLFFSIARARAIRRRVAVRHDHIVDVAALCCGERRQEPILVFLGARRDLLRIIRCRRGR